MTRYEIAAEDSQVWIEGSSSVHPIHASASGLTGWVEIDPTGQLAAGEIEIALERLSSGNPLVDRETRRRVDARRYPVISGVITSGSRAGTKTVEGRIDFRGETNEVSGTVDIDASDNHVVITGSQQFNVRDWGLKPPRLGLLKVHPEVTVRIHVEAMASA